jgi:hypothetical protein
MSTPKMNTGYPPLPILLGEENLQDWKLKVIAAFAVNGMADYLFNPSATITPEKMTLGMNILVPSLTKQRDYLTKAGWSFNSNRQQEPRALYNLVLKSIPQREMSMQVHEILYRFFRVEKGKGPVAKYVERIQSMRESLQKAGYIIDEHLLVTVTLHGLGPDLEKWGNNVVRNELAPGSLTFDKLVKMMFDAEEASEKKTTTANTTKNIEQVKGPVKEPPSCGRSSSSGPSSQASSANTMTNHARQAQNQSTQGANGKAKMSPDTASTSAKPAPNTSSTKANPAQARPMNPKPNGPAKANPTQTRPAQAKPGPSKMPGAFIESEDEHEGMNTTNKESEMEQLRRELANVKTEQDYKEFKAKHPNFWRGGA